MTTKRRTLNITFQPHALEQFGERFPGIRLQWLRGRLKQRIAAVLKSGAPVIYGAIRVEVVPNMVAVCAPDWFGWTVITVINTSIPRESENE